MQENIRVVLDAMGGDKGCTEMVKGAIQAIEENTCVDVILVGQEDVVRTELSKYSVPEGRVAVVHASEVIETGPLQISLRSLSVSWETNCCKVQFSASTSASFQP